MKNILYTILFLFYAASNINAQCYPDRHSTIKIDAWETCTTSQNPNIERGNSSWIMYDLGAEYPLSTIHLWNYNHPKELSKGVREMVIDFADNSYEWQMLDTVFAEMATGSSFYEGIDIGTFQKQTARYVLFTFLENWGDADCVGFAELRVKVADTRPAFELSTLNAACDRSQSKITLNWGTRFERNSDRFVIETSLDNENWENVGSVNSRGPSENTSRYKFVHIDYTSGDNYYRLKHYDDDGLETITESTQVECFKFIRIQIFPNPMIGSEVTFAFTSEATAALEYTITDVLGKTMREGTFQAIKGYSELKLDNLDLVAGNYILTVKSNNNTSAYPLVVVD